MKQNNLIKNIVWLASCFLLAVFLALPAAAHADQTRFFYDELGRLAGEDDGKGNVSVYHYDAVGNLLSIQRHTAAASGIGIFLLAPSSGVVGTKVEIRGFGFSPTAAGNQVAFNGKGAAVLSSTAQSIFALVPDGATTGPVTVTNANGTAASPKPFTVLTTPAPLIRGIDPNVVAQGTTTFMEVSGENLAETFLIKFSQGGLSASILPGATSQRLPIRLTVATNVPVGSYPFSVVTPFGSAQSGAVTISVSLPLFTHPLSKTISIFMPGPPAAAPSGHSAGVTAGVSVIAPSSTTSVSAEGPSATVAPGLSIIVPSGATSVAPSGPSASNSQSISVFSNGPSAIAVDGNSFSVAPETSVSMPP